MKCYHHIDTDAVGTCSVCGRPICEECSGVDAGDGVCPECDAAETPAPPPAEEQEVQVSPRKRKSSGAAFFLAFILPGLAHLYLGELLKALVIFLLFFHMVTLTEQSASLGILAAALYVFQIYDAVRLAKETKGGERPGRCRDAALGEPRNSVFWAWFLISVGILFMLHTLNVFSMAFLPRLLPLVLIIIGVKLIAGSHRTRATAAIAGNDRDGNETQE